MFRLSVDSVKRNERKRSGNDVCISTEGEKIAVGAKGDRSFSSHLNIIFVDLRKSSFIAVALAII